MKLKLSVLRNIIVGLLIFILGLVIGSRSVTTGLPFGLTIPGLDSVQRSVVADDVKLVGKLDSADKQVSFDTFWEVWNLLERDYLEPEKINKQDMVNGAIAGMTRSLDDPYTIYLSPEDNKRSGENLAGKFYGIGIELGYIDQTLAVISPLDNTPADQAGLEAGDLILHAKDENQALDEDTADWSLVEAVEKIRGPKGTEITLTIYREGHDETFPVTVTRGEIVVESVKLDFVEHDDKRVAHLKLSRFGGQTQAQWDQAVNQILAEKASLDGLVLDLRNNPGGYFDLSIQLASDFIERGTVVSQKGKLKTKDFPAIGQARLKDFPLVVLVNKGSASASEILAGALRDDLGAKLVGQKTFGKGTVQDRRMVSNGGGVHITVGRWLLPSGAWIHDEGLPVDVEVEANSETEQDEVLLKAIEELAV